jgi:FdhD protein
MAPDLAQMQDPLGLFRLGYAGPLLEHPVKRWEHGVVVERTESVAEEVPVAIVYNSVPHVVMMATPADLEDFALGFSMTEELIGSPSELEALEVVRYGRGIEIQARVPEHVAAVVAERTRRLTGRTGCGICGADSITAVLKELHPVSPGGVVAADAIHRALEALAGRQTYNTATGTVHAAAWATAQGDLQEVREDVGRHNALDKLIGALLKRGVDARSGFVVVTSRASFEMIQKTTVLGAPLMAAISGPTGLAIRVAQQAGLTLVGFARSDRLSIYTHLERVVGP